MHMGGIWQPPGLGCSLFCGAHARALRRAAAHTACLPWKWRPSQQRKSLRWSRKS